MPYGTPIIPIDQFYEYHKQVADITGDSDQFKWEDGHEYDVPQDYADMHGWEEMVENVARHYHSIKDTSQLKTMIYGASYGHAGALNFYKKKYNLPEANSTSASYVWWADENADFDQVLYIADRQVHEPWSSFNQITLLDSTNHAYARDPGYIYLVHDAHRNPTISWKAYLLEERGEDIEHGYPIFILAFIFIRQLNNICNHFVIIRKNKTPTCRQFSIPTKKFLIKF